MKSLGRSATAADEPEAVPASLPYHRLEEETTEHRVDETLPKPTPSSPTFGQKLKRAFKYDKEFRKSIILVGIFGFIAVVLLIASLVLVTKHLQKKREGENNTTDVDRSSLRFNIVSKADNSCVSHAGQFYWDMKAVGGSPDCIKFKFHPENPLYWVEEQTGLCLVVSALPASASNTTLPSNPSDTFQPRQYNPNDLYQRFNLNENATITFHSGFFCLWRQTYPKTNDGYLGWSNIDKCTLTDKNFLFELLIV
ncbi:hypothetical protein HDU97_000790 [Phlyctochytrium planicorne]|nr:hypothetical protein HDU97_000790 [Phlyctochytrium planicorne]